MTTKDILWLIPSRRRPQALERCFKAYKDTNTTSNGLVIVDRKDFFDNQKEYEKLELLPNWNLHISVGETLGDKIREVFGQYINKFEAIGFMGDDNIPVTYEWDVKIVESLSKYLIVSTDDEWYAKADKFRDRKMNGGPLWRTDLLKEIGYLFPPRLQHCFIDDLWENLGKKTKCWHTRMDVLVRHDHVIKLNVEPDSTYKKQLEFKLSDEAIYKEWIRTDRNRCLNIIRKLMSRTK